jgi:hypothetical protein
MLHLHPTAKPWSPRNRPVTPTPSESLYQPSWLLAEEQKVAGSRQPPIEIPEIKLQEPPKIAPNPKPLYSEMATKGPYYQMGEGIRVKIDPEIRPGPSSSPAMRILSIDEIEARYEHDPYDGYRQDYGNHRLEEIALSVYEDMKCFETFARRIVALPQDSFYELQVIRYIIEGKYRFYQRALHHFVMGKVRNLVEYYIREFANAYNPVFIDWFNHLQGFMTEDKYVPFPYMTHFHDKSFNQFIYRELMGIIMRLRERILRVDQHLISPIPSEFIMNSHYNNVRYMWNEEQLNYIHDNLYKIYHAIGKLIDQKISY